MNNNPNAVDILKMYQETWDEMKKLIDQTKSKAQKAMRITLFLKLIVTLSSIYSISQWLQDHHHANTWALILVVSEIAGVLLDTLPYFQQRMTLPQDKLKMEHIEIELKNDMIMFERGAVDEEEALRRYFSHRKSWLKVSG